MELPCPTFILLEREKDACNNDTRIIDRWQQYDAHRIVIKRKTSPPMHMHVAACEPKSDSHERTIYPSRGGAALAALALNHQPAEQQHIAKQDKRSDACERFAGLVARM